MIRIDLEKLNKVDKKIIKKKTKLESILSMEIIEEINLKLLETLKIEDQTTLLILITILLQGGGSNKNAGNSVNAIYEGHTLTSKQLLEIIQQFKKKGTIRQYARGIADEIQTVASILEIEGDLATIGVAETVIGIGTVFKKTSIIVNNKKKLIKIC